MHTPDDPEHYLRRAFDGTYSISGVPFLDGSCYEGCGNYSVYGHHMKNGSMFAALEAFYAKAYKADDKNAFRYYNYTDLTDEAVFDEYLGHIRDVALYDTGVTAEYGDQLLTLSTCSYHTADGRFVVVARQKPA